MRPCDIAKKLNIVAYIQSDTIQFEYSFSIFYFYYENCVQSIYFE